MRRFAKYSIADGYVYTGGLALSNFIWLVRFLSFWLIFSLVPCESPRSNCHGIRAQQSNICLKMIYKKLDGKNETEQHACIAHAKLAELASFEMHYTFIQWLSVILLLDGEKNNWIYIVYYLCFSRYFRLCWFYFTFSPFPLVLSWYNFFCLCTDVSQPNHCNPCINMYAMRPLWCYCIYSEHVQII